MRCRPVLAIEHRGYVFVCIALMDTPQHGADGREGLPSVALLPSVTIGVSLLQELQNVVAGCSAKEALAAEVQQYMGVAMPFGTLYAASASVVSKIQTTKLSSKPLTEKQTAWKPEPKTKGRDQLQIMIKESVRAIQYDMDGVPDVFQVYGHVQCKADVDNSSELSLSFNSQKGLEAGQPHIIMNQFQY